MQNLLSRPGLWALVIFGVVVALVLGWWLRRTGTARTDYDVGADRFAAVPPINAERIDLLHYLQQAFPDEAVLYRPSLRRVLAVRKSQDRQRAMQRLAHQHVDFLVCDRDGKPLFAFEVDAFREPDDADAAQRATEKNQMLKTAGIRLIRLKGSPRNLPPPADMRRRLQAVARTAVVAPSGFGPSGFGAPAYAPSAFGGTQPAKESDVMGLSGLMNLHPPADGDPWGDVRKR